MIARREETVLFLTSTMLEGKCPESNQAGLATINQTLFHKDLLLSNLVAVESVGTVQNTHIKFVNLRTQIGTFAYMLPFIN